MANIGDVNLTLVLVWHTTVSIMVSTIVRTYKPGIWYLSSTRVRTYTWYLVSSWYSSILIHILKKRDSAESDRSNARPQHRWNGVL